MSNPMHVFSPGTARGLAHAFVFLAALAGATAHAASDAELEKLHGLVSDWQVDEARRRLEPLRTADPDSGELAFVEARLLFFEGRFLFDEPVQAPKSYGFERASSDRRLHRAAGLLLVLAVAEAAVVHQLEHVGERPLDATPAAPQADCPHARRVDQPAAGG